MHAPAKWARDGTEPLCLCGMQPIQPGISKQTNDDEASGQRQAPSSLRAFSADARSIPDARSVPRAAFTCGRVAMPLAFVQPVRKGRQPPEARPYDKSFSRRVPHANRSLLTLLAVEIRGE
eukprot:3374035-Prymnesium_polylepis.1